MVKFGEVKDVCSFKQSEVKLSTEKGRIFYKANVFGVICVHIFIVKVILEQNVK